MSTDYYGLDDILADAERIPSVFELDVPGLNYLENEFGGDIQKGAKIDLPLWLAEVLVVSGMTEEDSSAFISMLAPFAFSTKVINSLKSSPVSVDLHSLSPVYYKLAERWLLLFGDEEFAQVLRDTLKERASQIFDFAYNSNYNKSQNASFVYFMDEFEKNLFNRTHDAHKQLKKLLNN